MPMELQGFDNLKDDLTNMASNLEFGAGVRFITLRHCSDMARVP